MASEEPGTGEDFQLGPWAGLIDRTNDLLCTANAEGYLELLNPAWTRVLGWSLEELRARPYFEFIHPDDLAATRAQATGVAESDGRFDRFENRYRTRDGGYRTLLWSASTDGERFYAMAKDITERRVSDERTADALARLDEAQSIGRIGSWEWDVGTGRLEWSAELFRLYGEAPDSFVPTYEAFMERVHPEDREQLSAAVQQSTESGEPYVLTHRIVRRDGAVRILQARGRAVHGLDGEIVRLAGTGQDVTEQVETATALRHIEARVEAQEMLRRRAIDLNDEVVQQLVVALMVLRGDGADLEQILAGTLDRAKEIVGQLLLEDGRMVEPGDLRRGGAETPS